MIHQKIMKILLIKSSLLAIFITLTHVNLFAQIKNKQQRIIILMIDGFGEDYYRNSAMPTLNEFEKKGIFKIVPSLMPSVTNLNNASICTGELPKIHGITGNSYFDTKTRREEFMENDSLLMAPTIFERAQKQGIRSILFAAKKKSIGLLNKGTIDTISPETASPIWVKRVGIPPSIYSREVNYWLLEAALYSIVNDSSLGIIYIHPTDYPMHTWAPESIESKEYLNKLDQYIAKIHKAAPDAAILITADHTVTHKSFCWDLNKALANRNIPIKIAISPERDKYFKHHRGFGGTAYVYLNSQKDLKNVQNKIKSLQGVNEVITRKQAVKRFHLMPERIGDLIVLGDSTTVFGDLDKESEVLPDTYRSHGALSDARVPLFIFNAIGAPGNDYFKYNYLLASWLYR
jgi:phosphonoacetate hydrolase